MHWFEIGVLDMNKRQMKKFVKRRQFRLKKNTRFNWDLPTDLKVFSTEPQIIVKDYNIKHHYRYSIKLITLTNWMIRVNKQFDMKRKMKKEFMFDKNINKIKGGEHIEYPSSMIINLSDHTAVVRGHCLTNEESSLVNIQDPVDGNVYLETVHNRKYEGAFVAPESLFKDKTCTMRKDV